MEVKRTMDNFHENDIILDHDISANNLSLQEYDVKRYDEDSSSLSYEKILYSNENGIIFSKISTNYKKEELSFEENVTCGLVKDYSNHTLNKVK
jgi:hypothetical protein